MHLLLKCNSSSSSSSSKNSPGSAQQKMQFNTNEKAGRGKKNHILRKSRINAQKHKNRSFEAAANGQTASPEEEEEGIRHSYMVYLHIYINPRPSGCVGVPPRVCWSPQVCVSVCVDPEFGNAVAEENAFCALLLPRLGAPCIFSRCCSCTLCYFLFLICYLRLCPKDISASIKEFEAFGGTQTLGTAKAGRLVDRPKESP